jgi:sugar lactone lactonase YvrE
MHARTGAAALCLVVALALPTTAGAAPGYRVVADHLNNPRGLMFGPKGSGLFVAEAGRAGTTCFDPETCVGFTGSITQVMGGHQARVVRGLISVGGKDGSFTVGADDVWPRRRSIFTVFTSGGPQLPPGVPEQAVRQLGNLVKFNRATGAMSKVADIDNWEFTHNPDGAQIDSDPYSLGVASGASQVVADAAGNDLVAVHHGHVSTLAVFPKNRDGAEPVPTSIARGRDGAWYVGELGGEGSKAGSSRVWRVVPGHRRTVFASNLTQITDIAFGPDGSLYVCEFTTDPVNFGPNGAIVRIRPNGSRQVLGAGVLHFPGGVAIGRHGGVYVSNWSILPSSTPANGQFGGAHGQVIKLGR